MTDDHTPTRRTVLKATAAGTTLGTLPAVATADATTIELTIAQTRRMRRAAEASERNAQYALDVVEAFADAYFDPIVDQMQSVDGVELNRAGPVDLATAGGDMNDPQTGRGVADITMRLLELLGHTQDDDAWSRHGNLVIDTPHWDGVLGVALLDDMATDSSLSRPAICDFGRELLAIDPDDVRDVPDRALFSDPAEAESDPGIQPEAALEEITVGREYMIANTAVHELLHNLGVHHHDGRVTIDDGVQWTSTIMSAYGTVMDENRCGDSWELLDVFERPLGYDFRPTECEAQAVATNLDADTGGVDDIEDAIEVFELPDPFATMLGVTDENADDE